MNNEKRHIIDSLEKVPVQLPSDDFFESLKSKVVEKISVSEPKIVPFYSKKWLQLAASIILVVGIGSLWIFNQHEEPLAAKKTVYSKVTKEEELNNLEENSDDVVVEELAPSLNKGPVWKAALPKDSIVVNDNRLAQHEELWEEIDKQDILDYLEEETIDLDEELIFGS